jgi:hypothetical protein
MRSMLLHLCLCLTVCSGAEIYGKPVQSNDKGTLLWAIFEGYGAKYGLLPSAEELAPLRKQFGPANRLLDFPYRIVLCAKLNRLWWGRHEGNLVLSAFGVHLATDAMLKEVEGMEQRGEVKFSDEAERSKFFAYYKTYRGDGVLTGEKARKLLAQDFPK